MITSHIGIIHQICEHFHTNAFGIAKKNIYFKNSHVGTINSNIYCFMLAKKPKERYNEQGLIIFLLEEL